METWLPSAGRCRDHHQRGAGDAYAALQGAADAGGDQCAGVARSVVRQDDQAGRCGRETLMPSINVALIGYAFMGKAHSNAYRQGGRFFSPRLTPRMKVLCGRTPSKVRAAARELGWDEAAPDWEKSVNRKDLDLLHHPT